MSNKAIQLWLTKEEIDKVYKALSFTILYMEQKHRMPNIDTERGVWRKLEKALNKADKVE